MLKPEIIQCESTYTWETYFPMNYYLSFLQMTILGLIFTFNLSMFLASERSIHMFINVMVTMVVEIR